MGKIIYKSDHKVQPPLPEVSLFSYLTGIGAPSPLPDFSPDLPAFIDGATDRKLTRGELVTNALKLAGSLNKLGLGKGSTACIWGYNSLPWAQAVYGCLAAGVTLSPANYAYEPHEVAHQLNNSGAELIFIDADLLPKFDKARKDLKGRWPAERIVLLEQAPAHGGKKSPRSEHRTLAELVIEGDANTKPATFNDYDAKNHDAWRCYSSGTTGLPKGVQTSHWNMTSQLQCANVAFTDLAAGQDVVLCFLPFSHIYAVTLALCQPFSQGRPVVVLPRFEEIQVLKTVEKHKVTMIHLVPPLFLVLLQSKNVKNYDLSSIRKAMSGAAPLSPEICDAFLKLIPGVRILQGYGMTETSPNITTMNEHESVGRDGWVGRLIPHTEARLVDPETGSDAPRNGPGELWVRSPSVMRGYHLNKKATEETIVEDGWLKTGDILIRDDEGWFKVVDRLKELIKYKGLQVAPAELEGLLLTHPGVKDTGVVGVWDDAQATEMPRAYVVSGVPPNELHKFVDDKVAQHKRLRGGIVYLDAIPKSPSGKILRKDLRTRAKDNKSDKVHYRAGQGQRAKL